MSQSVSVPELEERLLEMDAEIRGLKEQVQESLTILRDKGKLTDEVCVGLHTEIKKLKDQLETTKLVMKLMTQAGKKKREYIEAELLTRSYAPDEGEVVKVKL